MKIIPKLKAEGSRISIAVLDAMCYVFPFEPNLNWSKCYAGDAVTEKYIVHCVDKYGLEDPDCV